MGHFPNAQINSASQRLVGQHSTAFTTERILMQVLPYSVYILSEFNFVLFVLILFERIYSERKFNVGVTASSGHVV